MNLPFSQFFDPESFAKMFQNQFPFDVNAFQKQMQGTLSKPFQDMMNVNTPERKKDYHAFETHDHVIVQVLIPGGQGSFSLKLLLNSYSLSIKNLPGTTGDLTIPLPAPVKAKTAKAHYKNQTLEIVMDKRSEEPLTEITFDC